MLCKYPIISPNTGREVPLPCGQCLPCRINKRRVWTHRMMLENATSETSSFLTLTYSDENLPKEFMNEKTGQVFADNSVNPHHHTRFIDALRTSYRRLTGKKIRFFVCGEYGEKTGRPHLHYALFGYPPCCGSGPSYLAGRFIPCNCRNCSYISRIWGFGHIYLGKLEQASAQYVCGYVTKKLTADNEKTQLVLQGRHPEFARMSRMPGLGHDAAVEHGKKIARFVETDDDIPPFMTHDGKKWPLGRYLYGKIREAAGLPPLQEGEALKKYKEALSEMFESKTPVGLSRAFVESKLPASALTLLNAQAVLKMEKEHERKSINKKGI